MAWPSVYGPEQLAVAAFESLTDHAKALDEPADERTLDQKRADVFFDIILGTPDHPPGQPDRPEGDPAAPSTAAPVGGWGAVTVNLDVIVDHTRCPGPDG